MKNEIICFTITYILEGRAGEPEPGVFGFLEPEPEREPLEKNQEPERKPLGN